MISIIIEMVWSVHFKNLMNAELEALSIKVRLGYQERQFLYSLELNIHQRKEVECLYLFQILYPIFKSSSMLSSESNFLLVKDKLLPLGEDL